MNRQIDYLLNCRYKKFQISPQKMLFFLAACDIKHSELPCLREGTAVLESYNFSPQHLTRNLISLMILLFLFYLIGYICLLWRTKRSS